LIDLIGESNFLNQGEGEVVPEELESGLVHAAAGEALDAAGKEESAERTPGEKEGRGAGAGSEEEVEEEGGEIG